MSAPILLRAFVLFACLSAFIVRADYSAFLFVPGIPGEVADVSHTNWIAVNSFTEQQASALIAPGLKSYAFTITKAVDKASPLLAKRVADHLNIPSIHLQFISGANTTTTNQIYDLTFTNVTVAAFSQVADSANALETVKFNFRAITWTYTYFNALGRQQPVVTSSWDLSQTNGTLPNQSYQGNGDTSSGGAIGGGTLSFTNNATTIYGTFTKGAGTISNVLVLYIDNGTAGFPDTSGFNDSADAISRAVSGINGTGNRSLLTFANAAKPFSPAYAIALSPLTVGASAGTIFHLQNGGVGTQLHVGSATLAPTGTGNAYTYTFSFGISQIGLPPLSGQTFRFLGTYVTSTGSRSTEAIAGNVAGTAGWNPFTTVDVASYTTTAPAPPPVAIAMTYDPQAATLTFSWPITSIPYALQQGADVSSTQWTTLTNSATVVSNQNQIIVPVSDSSPSFYRLKY
ncbi:MAG: Hcp family type VI secretion system effector [Limisphaerales bacterium]